MALFTFHCIKAGTSKKALLYYDNIKNILYNKDKKRIELPVPSRPWTRAINVDKVSKENPVKKELDKIVTLKIQLGLDCNYRCSYCCQGHSCNSMESLPVDEFMALFPSNLNPNVIQFWGGEPLLYWKKFKPLAEALRIRFPKILFYLATNGSLLTYEINRILDGLNMTVGVSHDGPGQTFRGEDPLADQEQRAIIFDLFARLGENFRFSAMVYKQNASRKAINDWFLNEIGHEYFEIGEGSFFNPTLPEHSAFCLGPSYDEIVQYRRQSLQEIRDNQLPNMQIIRDRFSQLSDWVSNNRETTTLGVRCGNDSPYSLIVDLAGNVLTCQNCSINDSAPNGQPHRLGNLKEDKEIWLDSITHWVYRPECLNCPILTICLGGCTTVADSMRSLHCDTLFSDQIPFFAAGIEMMTGFLPYYIEGPQPEDRKDIFGAVIDGEILGN